MIVGHYAAALIPRAGRVPAPFWLFLLCANVPEFLWLIFALLGLESPSPGSILDASFSNLVVSMHYSHNFLPAFLQAGATAGVVLIVFRNVRVALWCAALVVVHVLCDYVVGFEHQFAGPDSWPVAMNLYGRAPYVAILIELAFSLACVYYFAQRRRSEGRPLDRRVQAWLYGVFAVGVLAWLPAARMPLRDLLRVLGL